MGNLTDMILTVKLSLPDPARRVIPSSERLGSDLLLFLHPPYTLTPLYDDLSRSNYRNIFLCSESKMC